MFAIVEAYRAGSLKLKNWQPNLLAGLIVGMVSLPLSMAFAIASGVKPEQGIYTAIVASILVGIFGGSQVQIAGPTGAFVVILANITAKYGVAGLQLASLLAGLILLIFGCLKIGRLVRFIPEPVIAGFTAGIGFIIFMGEWKDFFGLPTHLNLDSGFFTKFFSLLKALPHLDLNTTGLAILSLAIVLFGPKFSRKLPSPLIAIIFAAVLPIFGLFSGVATIGSVFGALSQNLPHFSLPQLGSISISDLFLPAFSIALLGAIESLLSATAADSMLNTRHKPNQELIAQGLANIFAPLLGGFAATGAIARTATSVKNGGNSPLAAIIHALVLIAVLIFLAKWVSYVPLCSLAAILFVVAYNMSDLPHCIYLLKNAPRNDRLILVITFLLTIFTNLVIAVNIGVILAMLFFVGRMRDLTEIQVQTLGENSDLPPGLNRKIDIYSIQGPFFFAAAEKLEYTLLRLNYSPEIVIFDLKVVPFIDLTGLKLFKEIIRQYLERGSKVYLCEANSRVAQKLAKLGITDLVEERKIFASLPALTTQLQNEDGIVA